MTAQGDWPDRRILDLFGIDLPILQAPMAFSSTPEMAVAVSEAGGLHVAQHGQAQYAADALRGAPRAPRKGRPEGELVLTWRAATACPLPPWRAFVCAAGAL